MSIPLLLDIFKKYNHDQGHMASGRRNLELMSGKVCPACDNICVKFDEGVFSERVVALFMAPSSFIPLIAGV